MGGDKAEEREQAKGVIERAERALRDGINQIQDPQAKREAIQSRQIPLSNDGVKEYRAEKREEQRAERAAEEERSEGLGR